MRTKQVQYGVQEWSSPVLDTSRHVWTLSEGGEESLGLSCTADGLFLGRTPLLERLDDRFTVRPRGELQKLLSSGFGIDVTIDRLLPGLRAVASALNSNDLCRARIAAVHLRIPDLPDALSRLEMETEDLLIKLEQRATILARGDWDPAKHPRAGTPPNPGWFAPAGSTPDMSPMPLSDPHGAAAPHDENGDDRVGLPPGDRNDEIGDLLEWIANAKPDDVQAISGEISRLFYQYGDFADGAAFHQALIEALANPDHANRQRILDEYAPITHHDPTTGAAVTAEIGIVTALAPVLSGVRALLPADEMAQAAEAAAASRFWGLGWAARGAAIHKAMGANLPFAFKTLDNFADGVATSIKSLDLKAATYQDTSRLGYRLNDYIKKLAAFKDTEYGGAVVRVDDITERVLHIVVPKGSVTAVQKEVFDAATERQTLSA